MTKKRIIAGIAVGSIAILYLLGVLWPIVRGVLTLASVSSLLATGFLGAKLIRDRLATESQKTSVEVFPTVAAAAATVFAFLVLVMVPAPERSTSDLDKPRSRRIQERELADGRTDPPADSQRSPVADSTRGNRAIERAGEVAKERTPIDASTSHSDDEKAVAEFMGALIGAASERQRQQQNDPRYLRFKQSIENANACPRCGGARVYRYVDGNGVLRSKNCQRCLGSGKAF